MSCLLPGCTVDDGREAGFDGAGACQGAKCDGDEDSGGELDDDPCEGGDICGRIDSCVGWSASAEPNWRFHHFIDGDFRTCLAYATDNASERPPDFDTDRQQRLLRSMMLDPSQPLSEGLTACAMLEQARQLCDEGTARSSIVTAIDPETNEPEDVPVIREGLCSPTAEVGCTRYEPAAEDFEADARASFAEQLELPASGASQCVRQTAGDCTEEACGYPLAVPSEPAQWDCSADDAGRLEDYVRTQLDGRVIGFPGWSVGAAGSNECRVTKALVDCVLPNLGPRNETDCPVIGDMGDSFDGFDYCFDIQQVTGGGGAHADGRAIDLNVPTNSGNLSQCDLGANPSEDYYCTNRERPTVVDLPPRFVSVMEGCGFQWGGRWGDPSGTARAEGRHLGCDPMHFELP